MRITSLAVVALLSALVACDRNEVAPAPTPVNAAAALGAPAPVAKIVFLDKENACACTEERIAGTWAALQSALGTPPRLPVQRLHLDTEAAQAGLYTTLKPLMVPPGVYFVDEHGDLVAMLEGEVEAAQIAAVLQGR